MCVRGCHVALCVLLLATVSIPVLGSGILLRDLDRRAIPMLVSKGKEEHKYGTGVIVGPTTILTANHVAAGKVDVVLPRAAVKGRAVCRAADQDLAVIKAPLPRGTPYYGISSKTPAVGEKVRVGGYPNRKWKAASGRVTHVISSATLSGRKVKSPMIVFRPALHKGASGAPVLNRRGQVIGIFVAANTQSNYSIAFSNHDRSEDLPQVPQITPSFPRCAGREPDLGAADPRGLSALLYRRASLHPCCQRLSTQLPTWCPFE